MRVLLKNILLLFAFTAFSGLIFSCSKDDTKGKVKVVYFNTGQPVEDATVKFTIGSDEEGAGFFLCSEGFITEKEYKTPSTGQIEECFELPALITVTAVGGDSIPLVGEGKLNLIEHETTTITVKLTSSIP